MRSAASALPVPAETPPPDDVEPMTDPTEAPPQEPTDAGPPNTEQLGAPAPAPAPAPAEGFPAAEGLSAAPAPAPSPPETAITEPAPSPIAPGVPRLARPSGTSRAIPETILGPRPSPTFLAVVSIVSLVSDVVTKLWAEKKLEGYPGYVKVFDDHLMFVLAKNKGGAWGLLQGQSENVRRPFFLLVSVAAIAFIVTLYRRLQPNQHALKWGLPLVLGGALGNVFDRIRYGFVIDFIDYRAEWIKKLNELIQKKYPTHIVTDHWPTFNVADIAICVGVGLMAVDMLTSRRGKKPVHLPDVPIEAAPIEAVPVEPAPIEAAPLEAAPLEAGTAGLVSETETPVSDDAAAPATPEADPAADEPKTAEPT